MAIWRPLPSGHINLFTGGRAPHGRLDAFTPAVRRRHVFHFFFVPLTLGLSILIAIMETVYVRTGDEDYRRMARFWGKIFIINFAEGVVTGITLEFQFGTNWARYSKYVGDIFGSLLAIEATLAFFLEFTFLAVWSFGWNRCRPQMI